MYQPGDIVLNINQNNKDNNNDEDNDRKPSVQEKKEAGEKKKADEEDMTDYPIDSEKPPKKKRQRADCAKSRFSFGCEIVHKELDLDTDDEPMYIDQSKFKSLAQEAQQ